MVISNESRIDSLVLTFDAQLDLFQCTSVIRFKLPVFEQFSALNTAIPVNTGYTRALIRTCLFLVSDKLYESLLEGFQLLLVSIAFCNLLLDLFELEFREH